MKKVHDACFETAWKPVVKLSKSEFDSYKATSFPPASQYVIEVKFGVCCDHKRGETPDIKEAVFLCICYQVDR